jgi:hypothetical protein
MAMDMNGSSANNFNNLAGAIFQFTGDGSVYVDGCCSEPQNFNNQGLVWKSGGSNTASISAVFNDQNGVLRADSGTLSLSGGAPVPTPRSSSPQERPWTHWLVPLFPGLAN